MSDAPKDWRPVDPPAGSQSDPSPPASKLAEGGVFEYPHSPIPFVLAGPAERGDQVLVRGGAATVDLIEFATRPLSRIGSVAEPRDRVDLPSLMLRALRFGLFFRRRPARPYAVATQSAPIMKNDPRESSLILAWMGRSPREDIAEVKTRLTNVQVDLLDAIRTGSAGRVEWILAPVIAVCYRGWRDEVAQVQRTRQTLWAILIVYGGAGLAVILWKIYLHFKGPG